MNPRSEKPSRESDEKQAEEDSDEPLGFGRIKRMPKEVLDKYLTEKKAARREENDDRG